MEMLPEKPRLIWIINHPVSFTLLQPQDTFLAFGGPAGKSPLR